METKVNYTVVGFFVILLSALIIFSVIWLSAGLGFLNYTYYEIDMKESVSGLSLDAPVEYNGVNVGSVTRIQIDPKNPRLVILEIKVKTGTPITKGTRAKINLRSLSGIGYIFLEDRGTELEPLLPLEGQKYAVIATEPSFFMQMDKALSQLSISFQRISHSVELLLNEENLRSFRQILFSTQSAMQQMATQTLPSANRAINNIDAVAHNLNQISDEVKRNPSVFIRGRGPQPLGPGEKANADQ